MSKSIDRKEQQRRLDKYFIKFPTDNGIRYCTGCHKDKEINIDNWCINDKQGPKQPCRECAKIKRKKYPKYKKKLEEEKGLTIEQYIESEKQKYEPVYDSDDID